MNVDGVSLEQAKQNAALLGQWDLASRPSVAEAARNVTNAFSRIGSTAERMNDSIAALPPAVHATTKWTRFFHWLLNQ